MAKNINSTLFTYRDADGVDVVVDRIEDVPAQFRGKMKVMSLDGTAEVKAPTKTENAVQSASAAAKALDPSSLGIGVAAGLVVGCLLGLAFAKVGGRGRIAGGLLTMLLMATLAAVYVGYVRQQTGVGTGSPLSVIGDTLKTKQLLENHSDAQKKALDAIERSEK